MSIDYSKVTGISDHIGNIVKITDASGRVIWAVSGGKVVLQVEKITSDTYAGETTYTAEEFILLDIYPKTNGTVSVTYGGLTKTITDTSGTEEPNAQQVYFGTFNGVADSVTTPASGELTIEGDCYAFGVGQHKIFSSGKSTTSYYVGITSVLKWGSVSCIPEFAFGTALGGERNDLATVPPLPTSVKSIRRSAFVGCVSLTSIKLSANLERIENSAFSGANIEHIEIPSKVVFIGDGAFSGTALGDVVAKSVKMLPTTPPELGYYTNSEGTVIYRVFDNLSTTPTTPALKEIVVPKGCGNAYKTATGWSKYADYITEAE